jgi:hypothetical protein
MVFRRQRIHATYSSTSDTKERTEVSFDSNDGRIQAYGLKMTIYKCPHCRAEYELIMTYVSYRQRSYAHCQVCWKTMYSWDSPRVPHFTLVKQPDNMLALNI